MYLSNGPKITLNVHDHVDEDVIDYVCRRNTKLELEGGVHGNCR